ncbi:hypothetical protein EI77_00549 [Prosthecobacter fusiformis]|uniref:Uncharacterized protein n=1 Tax=Prosthecobacter fusiformis TaxID=48464 RepID=A0A4R7SRZ9_9BACT|nr:hypothetical protein [Prosthecobacter fusiformis]TDU81246.1 hypothetical protein EI77_00549 [Prosthecobacter fusiformis]
MNTMLELSKDADYDTLAAYLIVSAAVVAKIWFNYKDRIAKRTGVQNQNFGG